ncbi:MAG: molybdopterin molybdotransferase MoeA [Desulfuromonadia bacterium]
MTTFHEARSLILRQTNPLPPELVPLTAAVGRVVAADIISPINLPTADNSAMDGYALRHADTTPGGILPMAGTIYAGDPPPPPLPDGTAVRIMTGALIPPGANAVVPWEETETVEEGVRITRPVTEGQHIRRRGEDLREGGVIVRKGTVLRPAQIGILASCGILLVPVHRRPTVAIVSTGDELINPGEPVNPGKVVNSNMISLAAAVTEAGGIPVMTGIARDTLPSTRETLARALCCDVVVTSAGVSAGEKDLVRNVLEEMGARQIFWKVEIKPGHPTAFALKEGQPIFSLPGNPVSSLITFETFVKPLLRAMQGEPRPIPPLVTAQLRDEIRKKPGRLHFIRVSLMKGADGTIYASSAGDQQTGITRTLSSADGLALIPEEETHIPRGANVSVLILNDRFDYTSMEES